MRRFSTLSKHLQKPKYAEFAFLQQIPVPPSRPARSDVIVADSAAPKISPRTSPEADLPPDAAQLGTTRAMKRLMNAVRRRQFADAENLFQLSPKLAQRPAALRLLIKIYCEQLDFTTAKAVLFATLSKVGEEGAARYIAHVTYNSQNSSDIEEVFNRTARQFGQVSPWFAANALFGLRFLGDTEAFDRVWRHVSQYWEPSLKPATLLVKVLNALLEEDWAMASKLWKISQGLSNADNSVPRLRIWYMACRYFLVENPKLECVDEVLSTMKKQNLRMTEGFTALLLRHLVPLFPAMSASQWIQYVHEKQWPLDGTVAEIIISHSQGGLTARFGRQLGNTLHEHAVKQLTARGLSVGRHKLGEGSRFCTDVKEIQDAKTGAEVIAVLKSMLKRGLRIPYSYFVQAFRKITQLDDAEGELQDVVAMMRSHGYPLHCAGTDLSMVELHCREAHYEKFTCKRLLGEYLVQYPMVSHDLTQLTRMAVLMMNCNAFAEAIAIVDSMRNEQQQNAKFNCANHDSASLQVIATSKYKSREQLAPFLRGVVLDSPNIYFDAKFIRKARRLLMLGHEELDVIEDLELLSKQTVKDTYAEIDEIADLVASDHNVYSPTGNELI